MSICVKSGPTYYFAPPRVFETQLTSVMIRMEDASRFKKWLFDRFMKVARKVGPDILDGKPVSLMDRMKYGLGELMIYGPLKNTLGLSRVRVGYTAGEAIGPEIFEFLPLAWDQPEAALRPNRSDRFHHRRSPMAKCVVIRLA